MPGVRLQNRAVGRRGNTVFVSRAGCAVSVVLMVGACRAGRPTDSGGAHVASELELNRELTYTTDPATKTWRTFAPRPGARVAADGVWQRYAPYVGIPISELVRVGPSRPAGIIPNAVLITYQQ